MLLGILYSILHSPGPQLPKCHRAGSRHIQRIHLMGHGDADGVVARRDGADRQSVSLCPQNDGQPFLRQEPGSSMLTEASLSAMAAVRNPRLRRRWSPALGHWDGSSPIRVHGTWKIVPMLTRTALR